MTDSNITSFSYRRKALGDLQRIVEKQHKDIERLQKYNDWQDVILDTLQEQKFMTNNLLTSIKDLSVLVTSIAPTEKK
jgi:hypothetical protein